MSQLVSMSRLRPWLVVLGSGQPLALMLVASLQVVSVVAAAEQLVAAAALRPWRG